MLVYAVRHAESLTNQGASVSLNPALSPLGIRQAAALSQRLKGAKFTAIYSSPFRRCIETVSQIASDAGLPIRLRPELFECHHQTPGTTLDTELPPLDKLLLDHAGTCMCPDWAGPMVWPAVDESRDQLAARMRSLAEHLQVRWASPDDVLLLVGHGSPLARLVEAWLLEAPGAGFRFVIDNCTVNVLRHVDGVSSLLSLNERSHLLGLPAPEISNNLADGTYKSLRPPVR